MYTGHLTTAVVRSTNREMATRHNNDNVVTCYSWRWIFNGVHYLLIRSSNSEYCTNNNCTHTHSPRLASYVFMYSDVMNCETRAVFPTPESPNITTRYFGTSTSSGEPKGVESTVWYPDPQHDPSNGDLSPDTLLALKQEHTLTSLAL